MTGPSSLEPADPVDPDVDLALPDQRAELRTDRLLLPAIALGGAAGASLRHLLEVLWPVPAGAWPWATLVTNLSGSLAMGLLMGVVAVVGHRWPLLRPFAGVGVLGGFTTMSTYAVGAVQLAAAGHVLTSASYLVATLVGATALAALGWTMTVRLRGTAGRPVATPSIDSAELPRAAAGSRVPATIRGSSARGDLVLPAAVAVVIVGAAAVIGAGIDGGAAATGWVALGALFGAPLRYLTDRLVQTLHSSPLPWGTLTVNVVGSLILGLVIAIAGGRPWVGLVFGVGFCGAYTTWSTTAHEIANLVCHGRLRYGIGYALATPVLCVAAAAAGMLVAASAGMLVGAPAG